jgi:glutamine---fructose-6-phosphate transaminase (isomerizing)
MQENNIYLTDILSQPDALLVALKTYQETSLGPLLHPLQNGEIDRIILTGMGASLFSVYPAGLTLAGCGVPVIWMDTAELVHYRRELITPTTLLWIVSQSGRSAEVVSLLDVLNRVKPKWTIGTVNDISSPLAQTASIALPLTAEPECAVSSRTYINSLAINQLAAHFLAGKNFTSIYNDLVGAVDSLRSLLKNWEILYEKIDRVIGIPKHLILLGRGPSMATVLAGSLFLQEVSKFPALGFQAAQFRHGPLEVASPETIVLIFEGLPETISQNWRMYNDLYKLSVPVFWVGSNPELFSTTNEDCGVTEERMLLIPQLKDVGLPLAEIIPVQILAFYLCQVRGYEPGRFLKASKVTSVE